MGVKDAIGTGTIVGGHFDVDGRCYCLRRMLRLSERMLLFWSTIDFMIKLI
jgi:hypothetical protein